MTDQIVEIVEYDPAWPGRFHEQATLLAGALAAWLVGPVRHIGSTSVPGLSAKPVIDMLAPVRSRADAGALVRVLEARGWLFWRDDPCLHYRLWFLRPRPEARTHHLQVIEHEDVHARALIAFRDALRTDRDLRTRYSALKGRLADRYRGDRNSYTDAKSDFVAQALRDVGFDPPPRDRLV